MSATNRSGRRAGILGLAIGFGVVVWFAAQVAARVGAASSAPPSDSKPPVSRPVNPLAGQPGQLGNNGQLAHLSDNLFYSECTVNRSSRPFQL